MRAKPAVVKGELRSNALTGERSSQMWKSHPAIAISSVLLR
jgi:hypothetical protein